MPMERASYGCRRGLWRELGREDRGGSEIREGGLERELGGRDGERELKGLERASGLESGLGLRCPTCPTRPIRQRDSSAPGRRHKKRGPLPDVGCGPRTYKYALISGACGLLPSGRDYSCSPAASASSIFSRSSARASRSPRVDFSAGAEVVALLLTFTSEGVASTLRPLAASS